MLSTTYTKQEYKILVHAAFGTFADGSVKEYTKEYTFTSNLKDNNTNLVLYINGKKVRELDPLNFICYINGVDYLAGVRAALGK